MSDKPEIVFDPFAVLTPKEKEWCRETLQHPTYRKMLSIVQKFRPSANCANAGSTGRDAFSDGRANARLGEIRGWSLYETALFAVLTDIKLPTAPQEESFPDSGRIDHNWGKTPE